MSYTKAIQTNTSLRNLNTFDIDVKADYLLEVHSLEDISAFVAEKKFSEIPRLILGGGSNILFTKDFPGVVILNKINGRKILTEDETSVSLEVGAGEDWHELVLFTIQNNWGGLENLSLVPGSVGAAPMQNIGAYGAEIKDSIISVTGMDLLTGEIKTFTNADCKFGYRDSIFKREFKENFIITSVQLLLHKAPHKLNTSYGAIEDELKKMGKDLTVDNVTISDVSQAVINIRKSKLPDPKVLGTAGSFFKNPIVEKGIFEKISQEYSNLPSFPEPDNMYKIPAGWLIDQAGWKGKRLGDAGVHEQHALVLVNYDRAKGQEVWDLAMKIQADVKNKFGITLEPEVNIY